MNDLATKMDQYLYHLKSIYEQNPEKAKEIAKHNLINAGLIDENKNICPPYNGKKVNDSDFTRGPIKIKKGGMKNGRRK